MRGLIVLIFFCGMIFQAPTMAKTKLQLAELEIGKDQCQKILSKSTKTFCLNLFGESLSPEDCALYPELLDQVECHKKIAQRRQSSKACEPIIDLDLDELGPCIRLVFETLEETNAPCKGFQSQLGQWVCAMIALDKYNDQKACSSLEVKYDKGACEAQYLSRQAHPRKAN